jgi:hypothetical protein
MHRFKPVIRSFAAFMCFALSALFASRACQAQSVIYVNAAATGLNDGTNWTDAFTDLQAALAAAQSGDEIWVVAGMYRPVGAGGARTIAFQLGSGGAIYGGFLGGETLLSERDPAVNLTTLSGDLNSDDGPSFANNGENSFHVVAVGAGVINPILDGLTITAGNANSGGDDANGGGLLVGFLASVTLRSCRFIASSANGRGGAAYTGQSGPGLQRLQTAAIAASAGGQEARFSHWRWPHRSLRVEYRCGRNGGVASAEQHPRKRSTIVRLSATLRGRTFYGGGGGMIAGAGSTLTACSDRTAARGGGLFSPARQNQQLRILSQSGGVDARPAGGGVSQNGGGSPTLVNCKFIGNTCDRGGLTAGGAGGGGMIVPQGSPNLISCVFIGNRALGTGGVVGGGISTGCGNLKTVINCTFANNFSAGSGGGASGGCTAFRNCVFRGNLPSDVSVGTSIDHSCTQAGWAGTGNIGTDPQFVRDPSPGLDGQWGTGDDDYGDLRLRAGSPCIDIGSNAAVPPDSLDIDGDGNTIEPTPYDLAGLPRFYDDPATADCTVAPGTCGTAPIADMGAHEFVASGDLNCDGHVTLDDLPLFVAALLDQTSFTGCSLDLADVNGDGLVDGRDIGPFITLIAA